MRAAPAGLLTGPFDAYSCRPVGYGRSIPEVLVIIRTFMAALAVIAVPLAVVGAQQPAQKKSASTKRVCEVSTPLGSRLGGVRRCRSATEQDEHKQEARQVVDRIQAFKPTCPGNGRC